MQIDKGYFLAIIPNPLLDPDEALRLVHQRFCAIRNLRRTCPKKCQRCSLALSAIFDFRSPHKTYSRLIWRLDHVVNGQVTIWGSDPNKRVEVPLDEFGNPEDTDPFRALADTL